MRMAGFYIKKCSPIRLFGEQIEYIVGRERPPPKRKPSPAGKFPRFAGKVARSAERGASAAEAKGGFERSEKTDEESYFYTRRLIHR